jgi:hypothetical protein
MLTEHKDDSVTMGKDRSRVCLEAAWELDALAALLGKLEDEGLMAFQVRAIAVRIVDLAGVLMMAVSDTGAQTDDLMKTVCPWKS